MHKLTTNFCWTRWCCWNFSFLFWWLQSVSVFWCELIWIKMIRIFWYSFMFCIIWFISISVVHRDRHRIWESRPFLCHIQAQLINYSGDSVSLVILIKFDFSWYNFLCLLCIFFFCFAIFLTKVARTQKTVDDLPPVFCISSTSAMSRSNQSDHGFVDICIDDQPPPYDDAFVIKPPRPMVAVQ